MLALSLDEEMCLLKGVWCFLCEAGAAAPARIEETWVCRRTCSVLCPRPSLPLPPRLGFPR